jgi:hypothetical protein
MIFESVGWYEKVLKPEYSTFITRKPIDWVNRTVTRLDHVLSSDYIFFDTVKDDNQIQSALQLAHIQNYEEESIVFRSWLAQLSEKDGIKVVSDKAVRLLKIIDHAQFERQIDRFISERTWRSEFRSANSRHSWWSASEVAFYFDGKPAASDIRFGNLFKLHVMALSRSGKEIKIEFWWEELQHEDCDGKRFMFFHFIDSEGSIRSQQHVLLGEHAPIHPDRRWRYEVVEFDTSIDSNITTLAFGVWYPDSRLLLMADKGVRDWNDRRVVVPINTNKENN